MALAPGLAAVKRPEDLFGALLGTLPEQLDELERTYRGLEVPADDSKRLAELYEAAQQAVLSGRYGRRTVFQAPRVIRGAQGEYRVVAELEDDKVAKLILTESKDGPALVKIARAAKYDDLLKNEGIVLARLNRDDTVESRLRPYVPELLESFEQTAGVGSANTRQANALRPLDGFYSLAEVRAAYPAGVHWRDMAWMMRRLLVAIGYAHVNGVLHGAVLPEHVWIQPEEHGLVLSDWYYATPTGVEALKHRPKGKDDWYPPEVRDKRAPGPATDVFLAARCMQYVLGAQPGVNWSLPESVPAKLRSFLWGCALDSMSSRPDDAWALKEEFDALLGPRKFRPFAMPSRDETDGFETPDAHVGEGASDLNTAKDLRASAKTSSGGSAATTPETKGARHG